MARVKQLRDFLLSMTVEKQRAFAKDCGTSLGQLRHIYNGKRRCNASLAIEIDKKSKGKVDCGVLCPDTDFNYLKTKTPSGN